MARQVRGSPVYYDGVKVSKHEKRLMIREVVDKPNFRAREGTYPLTTFQYKPPSCRYPTSSFLSLCPPLCHLLLPNLASHSTSPRLPLPELLWKVSILERIILRLQARPRCVRSRLYSQRHAQLLFTLPAPPVQPTIKVIYQGRQIILRASHIVAALDRYINTAHRTIPRAATPQYAM